MSTISLRRWSELGPAERSRLLTRAEENLAAAVEKVRPIVEAVKAEGDPALRRFTLSFEKVDLEALGLPLLVGQTEIDAAEASLAPELRQAIEYAVENVRRFHAGQLPPPLTFVETRPGVFAGERALPLASAGLYVPSGRGRFPSMVYMLAVPAALAGVKRLALATPPGPDGSVDPACLYAARLCGVHEVYRVGGAQAVAALAYGSLSIPAVDKLVGPGSVYVAAAKRLVRDALDTGLPAGPSESMIIADGAADARTVALDLLVEAEHGADSAAFLLTDSEKLASAAAAAAAGFLAELPEPRRGYAAAVLEACGIILCSSLEEAAELANAFAPEHLSLRTAEPFGLLHLIENAGEILLGAWMPFSAANYAVGANAVLPTNGKARTWSPVSVRDFMKFSSVAYASAGGLAGLGPCVAALADYEGFPAHAAAVRRR